MERVLIAGVAKGGDRQDLHERLRQHAMDARTRIDDGAAGNDFFERVVGDQAVDLTMEELEALADPTALVGRAPAQVDRLLRGRVDALLAAAKPEELGPAELRV